MTNLDIILLIILAIFIINGLRKGIIRSIGRIFALIISIYIASNYYLLLYTWGQDFLHGQEALGKVLAFIILFIASTKIVQLIFFLLERAFNLVAFIPGSKYINNILGGLFALIEAALFFGLILFVINRYLLFESFLGGFLEGSVVAPLLIRLVDIVLPIMPKALNLIS